MMAVYALCLLLVIPLGIAIFYRSLFLGNRQCLQCGAQSALERIPRSRFERTLGRLVASRRYRCGQCGWIGLIREGVAKQANEPLAESESDPRSSVDPTPIPTHTFEDRPGTNVTD